MPIIPLKCPSCGASLQINSDDSIMTCQYCGTASVVKDAIVQNYIQNTININANTVNIINSPSDFEIVAGTLVKYNGSERKVIIPDGVEIIGSNSFTDTNIIEIVLAPSVKKIEKYAFSGCKELKAAKLNDGLEEIEEYAFDCASLQELTLPNSMRECSAYIMGTINSHPKQLEKVFFNSSMISVAKDFVNLPGSLIYIIDGMQYDGIVFEERTGYYVIRANKGDHYKKLNNEYQKVLQSEKWANAGLCFKCGGSFEKKSILGTWTCKQCGFKPNTDPKSEYYHIQANDVRVHFLIGK